MQRRKFLKIAGLGALALQAIPEVAN